MTEAKKNEVEIIFARNSGGSFVGASTSSPFFCISGASEAEARSRVDAALRFYAAYRNSAGNPQPALQREVSIVPLVPASIEERSLEIVD
jgi:hypothetical protein